MGGDALITKGCCLAWLGGLFDTLIQGNYLESAWQISNLSE
jgi:hypothetical protein